MPDNELEEQLFDCICIDAWRADHDEARARSAAERIIQLASLRPGSRVVDFGCGTGGIARRLALSGVRVMAIDRSHAAIEEATSDPHPLCTFLEADWRDLALSGEFDCALFWGTTLCSGDELDLQSLRAARRCLSATGVLIVETRHWDRMVRRFEARSERRFRDGVLVEDHCYDPLTGTQSTRECFFLDQTMVQRQYRTRRYSFVELRGLCLRAGFTIVRGYDEAGSCLNNQSERVVLLAASTGVA